MNREERRKAGISKETADKLNNLNSPCTILEAIQLSQGVSEDAIADYHRNINPIIISLSVQIEVLKELLFKSSIDEKKFLELFNERVEDYHKQKEEAVKSMEQIARESSNPKTTVDPGVVNLEVIK